MLPSPRRNKVEYFRMGRLPKPVLLASVLLLLGILHLSSFFSATNPNHATTDSNSLVKEQPSRQTSSMETQDATEEQTPPLPVPREYKPGDLGIAWLMSFPNSGTTFTMRMIRRASNLTTGTNYGLESVCNETFNVPVPHLDVQIKQEERLGPFITGESIYQQLDLPSSLVMTKTHCSGGADPYTKCRVKVGKRRQRRKAHVKSADEFAQQCGRGYRIKGHPNWEALQKEKGELVARDLEVENVEYKPKLARRAIHLMRHPMDNLVARYHYFSKGWAAKQTKPHAPEIYNSTGIAGSPIYNLTFAQHCRAVNQNAKQNNCAKFFFGESFSETIADHFGAKIPCWPDLLQYVQWHDAAFRMSTERKLPTLLVYYEDYAHDFEIVRKGILDWLEQPLAATDRGPDFGLHEYHLDETFFTQAQKEAIWRFLKQTAGPETWKRLQFYKPPVLDNNDDNNLQKLQ